MTRDLVVFSLESWDDIWRRNQYLVDGLLRRDPGLRVLFVEPANDLLHNAVSGRRIKRGAGLRVADGYDGRLALLQPDKVLPRTAGPAADALLRRSVARALRRLGMAQPALWVNDPNWAGIVTGAGSRALYDMTDDWLAANRSRREHARIAANEELLMATCRAVVVCSQGLYDTRSHRRPVVLIPNAVDVERYRTPRPRPADLPERSALYVGTMHEDRLDVDLILRTADAAAAVGGIVVLVGPSVLSPANTARLASHPTVRLLGPRPWSDIPAYLQHASVLIVPHVVDEFTDSLDPIKLYEYRVVGRPIVSTPVAGFRDLAADGVTVQRSAGFASAVVRWLETLIGSSAVDDVPDWGSRVDAYGAVLAPMLDAT